MTDHPTGRRVEHADEIRSRTLHSCWAANVDPAAFGLFGMSAAIVSPDTIRLEHDHTDVDGVRRRYVVLISVSVHTEENRSA